MNSFYIKSCTNLNHNTEEHPISTSCPNWQFWHQDQLHRKCQNKRGDQNTKQLPTCTLSREIWTQQGWLNHFTPITLHNYVHHTWKKSVSRPVSASTAHCPEMHSDLIKWFWYLFVFCWCFSLDASYLLLPYWTHYVIICTLRSLNTANRAGLTFTAWELHSFSNHLDVMINVPWQQKAVWILCNVPLWRETEISQNECLTVSNCSI